MDWTYEPVQDGDDWFTEGFDVLDLKEAGRCRRVVVVNLPVKSGLNRSVELMCAVG